MPDDADAGGEPGRAGCTGRVGTWARRWARALAAEAAGTALLVALGVASLVPGAGGAVPALAHAAFAFGGAVLVCVEAAGAASGAHLNPAVTLAALVRGRLPPGAALAYALAQTAGALAGCGALTLLVPGAAAAGVTAPSVPPPAAAALEALLTGALVLQCCALWAAHDAGRPDAAASLKLALLIAGLVFSGGAFTGASLNPARSLAPALLAWRFPHHWVYWVGPLGGAAAAALLHGYVLLPPARRPAARALAECVPLRDKLEP